MSYLYSSVPLTTTGLTSILPVIGCLERSPTDELLGELYGLTNRIEVTCNCIYLELDREDLTLFQALYNTGGVGSSKQEAHLNALARVWAEGKSEPWVKGGSDLPIAVLEQLGLKPTTVERLSWLGMATLADLKRWSKAQLQSYLGDEAKLILPYIKGPVDKNVALYVPPKIITESHTFTDPALEPYLVNPALEQLVLRSLAGLGEKAAIRLELKVSASGITFMSERVGKTGITPKNLYTLAEQALEKSGALGLELEQLSLSLKGLYRPGEQGRLFDQKKRMIQAVQKVERRFPGALLKITESDPYSLLPEFRYSLEPINGEVTRGTQTLKQHHLDERPTSNSERQTRLLAA